MICGSREDDYKSCFYETYDSVQSGRRKTAHSITFLLTIVHYMQDQSSSGLYSSCHAQLCLWPV